jgi:plasmid replication initiation protein|tara:strand:- start:480 stop:1343 length:864 start_codon:yes stop_codon:yes gene_type:complete
MDQLQVYKSNALIEAQYRLSVAEQRIMYACISQVRRDQPITDDVLYSISASELAEMSGTSPKQAYRELEKAALRLKRRDVRLIQEPNGQGRKRKVMITGWVQTIIYIEEEGRVELRLTKDMLPYLTNLTEQFTNFALKDVARMTSSHGQRLYELLSQWRSMGRREVSIDWLRNAFLLEGKYPALKDFKRRVLEPAVEQLNEHSPLWVKWDQRKTGRRVSHLIFTFGEKAPQKLQPRRKTTAQSDSKAKGAIYGIPMAIIKAHAKPGESESDAALRLLDERKHAKEQT